MLAGCGVTIFPEQLKTCSEVGLVVSLNVAFDIIHSYKINAVLLNTCTAYYVTFNLYI